MEAILMTVPPGIAPRTKAGDWGIIMLHVSGKNEKAQWFSYRPSLYGPALRIEWPLGTMMATVPPQAAEVLVNDGYARVMTLDEARSYNKSVERLTDNTSVKLNIT